MSLIATESFLIQKSRNQFSLVHFSRYRWVSEKNIANQKSSGFAPLAEGLVTSPIFFGGFVKP